MRRNYERTLIPVIRSVKHSSTCGESTELNHGAHFWAPSTSPQNWGHLSWWGQSKRPHSNLGRCRCVVFGTGSHTAIPSAQQSLSWPIKLGTQLEYWGQKSHTDRLDPLSTSIKLRRVEGTHKKNRLEPLSSVLNLRTEVENHTQTPLDSLSTLVKMTKVEGNGTVKCEIIHCNLHGVMEFYRFSTQPGGFMAFETIWNFCTFFVYLFEITHKNDHLAPLSSLSELDNEVGGHTSWFAFNRP